MNIRILLFGITRDIVGSSSINVDINENENVEDLMSQLRSMYPGFNDLKSLMVAVNSEYAEKEMVLKQSDEIALIPPVSGG